MTNRLTLPLALLLLLGMTACEQDPNTPPAGGPKLQFKFKFDPNQTRLNSAGQPATVPANHAAQSPDFNAMSVHYIELIPSALTLIGGGEVVYHGVEQAAQNPGGQFTSAAVFAQAIVKDEGEVFFEIPLADVSPGTYTFARTSVTYQNYDIRYNLLNVPFFGNYYNQPATIASFVGFNTFITNLKIKNATIPVNGDRPQGFWAFETPVPAELQPYTDGIEYGQAPAGATTVVNPIFATSPIPPGSCLVTGAMVNPITITGNETENITILLSYSTNNSFEWVDTNNNDQLDMDATTGTVEQIVDMGLRGLSVIKE